MRNVVSLLIMACLLAAAAGCATRAQVKKALSEDPDLLMEALTERRFEVLELLQSTIAEKEALAREEQAERDAAANLQPEIGPERIVEGAVDAPVTIVEYSDFQCPYCVRGHLTMNELLRRHPGKVRVVFKHNPVKEGSFGLAALYEAVATIDPEAALRFKDLLFANQKAVHDDRGDGAYVAGLIESLGLDPERVDTLARTERIGLLIEADVREANSFGLQGTPMFVVGGMPVRGAVPIEHFEEAVSLALERAECVECQQ